MGRLLPRPGGALQLRQFLRLVGDGVGAEGQQVAELVGAQFGEPVLAEPMTSAASSIFASII